MKVFLVGYPWIGGMIDSLGKAFTSLGYETEIYSINKEKNWLQKTKLNQLKYIERKIIEKNEAAFNQEIISRINKFNPDLFFVLNEGNVHSTVIQFLKKKGVYTICYVVDNPFDSYRFSQLPISFKYFDSIFVADKIWIPSISNVASTSSINLLHVGYNSDMFFTEDIKREYTDNLKKFSCDVSFTGESYGLRAEGAYRVGVLDHLSQYTIKIWGDKGWNIRKPYHPILEKAYKGERLPYNDLRALYRISKINLNIPAPQILTAFQPRLFEIPACKGFQIVDWREDLDEIFDESELVTFKNIPDLLEKVDYFVKQPEKRLPYIEKMYAKVIKKHRWEDRAKKIIEIINIK